MDWTLQTSSPTPPSRQLVETVLDAIARGELAAGDRLPSIRGLAAEVLVNPNTVARAYRDLESQGVARGKNGLGVFLTDEAPEIAAQARSQTTLATFQRACTEALRNGHSLQTLIDILRSQTTPERDSA